MGTYILVANPELLRRVMATNASNYKKDAITYAAFRPLLGNGLVTAEGELWKKQRAILGKVFRSEILTDVVRIADEAAQRLIEEIEPLAGTGTPYDFLPPLRRLTLEVIADAVLSLPPEITSKKLPDLYLPIVEEANLRTWNPVRAYLPTAKNRQIDRCIAELDRFVTDIIVRRKRDGNPTGKRDILDRMMQGQAESGEPWDDRAVGQLRDEVKTFLVAGHETSSMMLAWALFELTRHPAAMERVIAEANECFPHGDLSPERALKGLEYSNAVLKETLREYSLVPAVTREAIEDDMLGPYFVPKGAKIVVAIDALHHDASLWPDPNEWRPERFLEPLPHPYAFQAFITGSRSCIGEQFSLIEGKVVLARLVQRFRFLAASKDVGVRHPVTVPVVPDKPMHLYVEEHAS
jgi:cytochrome P450